MAEGNQDMRACQTIKRVGPEYQGAASVRSGKSLTIAGYVGSRHAWRAGGPMQVQAARADLRRGKSRGTRAKDHSMLHHATQEIHLEGRGAIM